MRGFLLALLSFLSGLSVVGVSVDKLNGFIRIIMMTLIVVNGERCLLGRLLQIQYKLN